MRSTAPHLFFAVTFALACRAGTPEKSAAPAPSPAPAAVSTAALAPASAEDRAVAAADVPSAPPLTGKVIETIDAGGYTYLRLDTPSGVAWAAVEPAKVAKGARVTVRVSVTMQDFESRTLGRKFDRVAFGTLDASGPGAPVATSAAPAKGAGVPPAMAAAVAAQHASAAAGPADVGPIRVSRAPAPDGRTVAEVFEQRAALDTRTVAVRGKVVKFLPGIMGRNWLHLRDGTGSAEQKDHDLTVTTSETASVGDVVLVRGTVRKDLDFGAGYAYAVLVEEAKLSR